MRRFIARPLGMSFVIVDRETGDILAGDGLTTDPKEAEERARNASRAFNLGVQHAIEHLRMRGDELKRCYP